MTTKTPPHLSAKAKALWVSLIDQYGLEAAAQAVLQTALEHMDLGDVAREKLRTEDLDTKERKLWLDSVRISDGIFLRSLKELGLETGEPPLSASEAGKRAADARWGRR